VATSRGTGEKEVDSWEALPPPGFTRESLTVVVECVDGLETQHT